MNDALARIVDEAVEQAAQLADLEAAWVEAWASDLLALAAEASGRSGETDVLAALVDRGAVEAVKAIKALSESEACCEAAFELRSAHDSSIALQCSYRGQEQHFLVVDLVPGPPHQVADIQLAPSDLLDGVAVAGGAIQTQSLVIDGAAYRIVAALEATERPSESAVANGRLLLARLASVVAAVPPPLSRVSDEYSEWVDRHPDDDRFALDVFNRALGQAPAVDGESVREVAERLRDAAANEVVLAMWLAASPGPVDLDEPDEIVVAHALAATIAPQSPEPLSADQRTAAMTLEPADWLGALVELVRDGPGASVDPDSLVDRVNRCPEVTTTIAKADRARVAWAFGVMCGSWLELGVLADGRLTDLGAALIPQAVTIAWAS